MIQNTAINSVMGIKIVCIKFPIRFVINNNIGCIIPLVVILPVNNISDISIGIKQFIKPTRLLAVSFTRVMMSEKFAIIIVTIAIYCT